MLTRTARRGAGLMALLWLLGGCDSSTPGGGEDPPDRGAAPDATLDRGPAADRGPAPDAAPPDAAPSDAAPPDAAPPDAAVDAAPPDCMTGERMCAEGEPPARLECTPGGRWGIVPCAPGEVCLGDGACVPDPATCVEGARVCLGERSPAVCTPGEGWVEASPCLPGWVCSGDGRCRSPQCSDVGSQRTYLGCDFWATDLPNLAFAPLGGTPEAPLGLVLASPDPDTRIRVWVREPDGSPAALVDEVRITPPPTAFGAMPVTVYSELRAADNALVEQGLAEAHPVDIPPGGMAVLLLPHHGYTERSVVRPDAWRVQTDRPVAAYQFNPYCCNYSFTNDASLLLPIPALGTEYMYIGVPAWQDAAEPDPGDPNPVDPVGLPATLTVVGTQAATDVDITLPPGASVQRDAMRRITINGQQVTARIDAGEVLTLMSTTPERRQGGLPLGVDLTGATVRASAPVAVFSGHLCTFYPQDQEACDHLEEQLFPTDTWGNRFVLAPAKLRTQTPDLATEATFWKMVARDDDTFVRLTVPFDELDPSPPGFVGVTHCRNRLVDPQTINLQRGQSCEFGTRLPLAIDATRPISVMGIISGQASVGFLASNAGDPAIFLLPPEYQFRRDYAFLAPTTYFVDYLTVVAPADAAIELDGAALDLADAQLVPGTTLVYKHFEISDGTHRVSGDQPFGILVYAYDDYVSYAFTGGQNLIKR